MGSLHAGSKAGNMEETSHLHLGIDRCAASNKAILEMALTVIPSSSRAPGGDARHRSVLRRVPCHPLRLPALTADDSGRQHPPLALRS
jgi:hypothetical protein